MFLFLIEYNWTRCLIEEYRTTHGHKGVWGKLRCYLLPQETRKHQPPWSPSDNIRLLLIRKDSYSYSCDIVQWNLHGRNTIESMVLNRKDVVKMESITSIHVCNSLHLTVLIITQAIAPSNEKDFWWRQKHRRYVLHTTTIVLSACRKGSSGSRGRPSAWCSWGTCILHLSKDKGWPNNPCRGSHRSFEGWWH
jgi:hypothetical protein